MPDFKKMPNFAALKNLLTMKNSLVFAYSTHKANRLKPCSDGRILHFMPASMIRAVSAGVKKPSSQNTSMKSANFRRPTSGIISSTTSRTYSHSIVT